MHKHNRYIMAILMSLFLGIQGCSSVNTSGARSAAASAEASAQDALAELRKMDAEAARSAAADIKRFNQSVDQEDARLKSMSGNMSHFAKKAKAEIQKRRKKFANKGKKEGSKTRKLSFVTN